MKQDTSKPLQVLLRGADITMVDNLVTFYKTKYNLDISRGALFRKLLREEFDRIKNAKN